MSKRPRVGLRRRWKRTIERWFEDDGNMRAASISYFATFSFFPLLLILISALGLVLRFSSGVQDAQQQFLQLLAENTSEVLTGHVEKALMEIRTQATVGGPLGLCTLILAAVGVFTQFDAAFDRIWNVKRSRGKGVVAAVRNALVYRLRAFLMLLGVGFLVIAAFFAGIAASAVRSLTAELPGGSTAWTVIQLLTSVMLNCLLFTVIYKVLPKVHLRWSAAARGGIVAAVLWEASRVVLTILVLGKQYTAYGLVGSLVALMLWIYVANSVLLLGAEYVRVIYDES